MEIDGQQILLFDQSSDPGEQVNLAAEHLEIVAEMSSKLQAIKAKVDYHVKHIVDADEIVQQRLRALGYLKCLEEV